MPASLTLRHAKRLSVSRSLWPLMSVGLFAMNPLCSALADVGKVEDSTLTDFGHRERSGHSQRPPEYQQCTQLGGYPRGRYPRKDASQLQLGVVQPSSLG